MLMWQSERHGFGKRRHQKEVKKIRGFWRWHLLQQMFVGTINQSEWVSFHKFQVFSSLSFLCNKDTNSSIFANLVNVPIPTASFLHVTRATSYFFFFLLIFSIPFVTTDHINYLQRKQNLKIRYWFFVD